jgi:hypothetical protein
MSGLTFKEQVKPLVNKFRLPSLMGRPVDADYVLKVSSDDAKIFADILEHMASVMDARTKEHLHWTAVAQQIDIYSVYLSGLFVGLLLGIAWWGLR